MVLLSGVVFAQTLSKDGRFLLRKATPMPDGRLKIGALTVEPGKDGGEAKVKTFILTGNTFKEEFITMSELAKCPSPIKGFLFGVSTDNELILIDKDTATGTQVGILRNAQGKHDVPSRDMKAWLAGKVSIIKAARTADGRIRIGKAPGAKPVAAPPAKQPAYSVLTGPDGVDMALVGAGKQKAAELKGSITTMFVDATGRTRVWPPNDSPHPAYFRQDDMILNVCSKIVTFSKVKLGKGEVAVLSKKPGGGRGLVWVKTPWGVTTSRSIWVSLVGDYGRRAKADVQVYVLSAKEFSEYWAKREKDEIPKLNPRGGAPLLVQNLKPGRYVVGVRYVLDLGVFGPSAISGKLDMLKYVEDDVAEKSEFRAEAVKVMPTKLEVMVSTIRWYSIDVASETVHPVVSLFVPKGASSSRLRALYPRREQFRINASGELLEQLWLSLDKAGAKTTTEQRKELLDLLARGGRVCVPSAKSPAAIFLDCDGKPRVAARD